MASSATTPKNPLKLVFGTMTIGAPNTLGARLHTPETAGPLLDTFAAHGHKELDSARVYGNGTTEELLAALSWEKKRNLVMGTKLYPNKGSAMSPDEQYTHSASDVRKGLSKSLSALQTDKIDLFYLHGPDRKSGVSMTETLRAVNDLYKEGKFNRFGVSNFQSWEVAQICEICIANDWIRPTVYQGIYHALQRSIEAELIPCLRFYAISLYAFQPLAGGFLTGRYTRDQEEFEPGSRFDKNIMQGKLHQGRYWNDAYFDAVEEIQDKAKAEGLSVAECALRWLEWHSLLDPEKGDAIIVGASSVAHLEGNLSDLEKGTLPESVLEVFDPAWVKVKGLAPKYWH